MKNTVKGPKIDNCNNFNYLSEREACLERYKILNALFPESELEEWKPIIQNGNYLISNRGRVKHLFSYGGRARILYPTIRYNKYPYVTITISGKRIGIAVRKLVMNAFHKHCPYRTNVN